MTEDIAIPPLPSGAFAKVDEGDDHDFYVEARLVAHIDTAAIQAPTAFYRDVLPPGGVLLDLMSSWVSHLPGDITYGEVIGHGMNPDELAANPRLSRWFIQDFNRDPSLPLESGGVDAVTICVGIQYLQRPVTLLRETARVLRPGGMVAISFSNRCFPTKAVAIWKSLDSAGHCRLVEVYLRAAGFAEAEVLTLADGCAGDPLSVVVGRTARLI